MSDFTNPYALLLFAAILYFVPSIIAKSRDHQNLNGIVLVNLIAGWTVLGWLAALVMACGEVRQSTQFHCPDCQSAVTNTARFCPSCGAALFE